MWRPPRSAPLAGHRVPVGLARPRSRSRHRRRQDHLIRLSDGRDLVLDIENQAGPSHAELEPAGLFDSWNEACTSKPGRLAFVPWEDVVGAFG
jgi:hypothetical protein